MDKTISYLLKKELERQRSELELIASENYVSKAVLDAYANVFTNKYSEGYPGKRYYGGQQWVDRLELLTQYRALGIFDLLDRKVEDEDMFLSEGQSIGSLNDFIKTKSPVRGVNVQPLSGSPANLAVYLALLKPGDTILGMDLNAGGHLSHGFRLNASGIFYDTVFYGVDPQTNLINREQIKELALKHKPKIIVAGYSAYPRLLEWQKFAQIADEVQKVYGYRPYLMADIAHIAGLIAGRAIGGPFEWFDVVTTTTHKTLRGPRGALIYFRWDLEKDINRGVFPGVQGGPHEHIVLAKAVAFGEILKDDKIHRKEYVNQILSNAQVLAQTLSNRGWELITGGTDNHLVLVDVAGSYPNLSLDGKIAEKVLEGIGLSINKNSIPFDPNPPLRPSGIRLGSPALTTRGFGIQEFKKIGEIIDQALKNWKNQEVLSNLKEEVEQLANNFPLPY